MNYDPKVHNISLLHEVIFILVVMVMVVVVIVVAVYPKICYVTAVVSLSNVQIRLWSYSLVFKVGE